MKEKMKKYIFFCFVLVNLIIPINQFSPLDESNKLNFENKKIGNKIHEIKQKNDQIENFLNETSNLKEKNIFTWDEISKISKLSYDLYSNKKFNALKNAKIKIINKHMYMRGTYFSLEMPKALIIKPIEESVK